MTISVSSKRFSKLQQKYEVTQFCLSSQFNGFVYAVFSMFEFGQNLTLESFQPCLLVISS